MSGETVHGTHEGTDLERELVYELPSAHALKEIAVAGPAILGASEDCARLLATQPGICARPPAMARRCG